MRNYLVFGSNDGGETLTLIGEFEAADHDAAKKLARDSGHEAYGSCPSGNWSFAKVNVREVVEVEPLDMPVPGQMTVDEVLEEAKDDAIAEAREVLDSRREPDDGYDSRIADRS